MVVLFVIASALAGRYWPISLIQGEDGRLSSSKAQIALWTAAVAYSYVTLYAARAYLTNNLHPIDDIPGNVMLALGFSVTTAVGAKAITVNKINKKEILKDDNTASAGLGDLVAGDDGCPDLSKVQLLFWTVLSIFVYVALTHGALAHYFAELSCAPNATPNLKMPGGDVNCLGLPNIDPVLMVLMGLAHGTYLGGKLTQANLPRITGISPLSGPPGTHVILLGVDFGTVPGILYLDNVAYWGTTKDGWWTDGQVAFDWPAKDSLGNDWKPGANVPVTLATGGQRGQGAAAFTVTKA